MLKINLSNQAKKFLAKLTPKHKRQLAEKIQSLGDEPRPSDSKSMKGFDGYLRADSGEYRIIYRIDTYGAVLLVAILGNRNDGQVYKLFRRLNS